MNLFLQSDRRHLHFVGIGGAGVGALGMIALRRGIRVTGSDSDPTGARDLVAEGAAVFKHDGREAVPGARAVVASAAIAENHPDLVRARELGIPIIPRKVALAGLIGEATSVAIAGTHGKTTTTVMTTEALLGAGFDPTGLAGGRVAAWGGNARLASDQLYVVEADEYDQAFLTLTPTVAVINNVEADHLECYGTVDAMEAAFGQFATSARQVLIGNADPGADRVAAMLPADRVWRFGPDANDIRLEAIDLTGGGGRCRVRLPDGRDCRVSLAVPGLHNLRNAAGALGAVVALGGDPERAAAGLARFRGVGRRFERVGEVGGVIVIDDYAHHPTELAATLAAARQAYPERRLVAAFQPHLFSRTALHARAMGAALAAADMVVVADVYPAREQPIPGVTGALVADAARAEGAAVSYEPTRTALGETVTGLLEGGDLLLTLGAGDITQLGPDVLRRLERK